MNFLNFLKGIFSAPAQAQRLAKNWESDVLAAVNNFRRTIMAAIDDIRKQIADFTTKAEARITALEQEIAGLKAAPPVTVQDPAGLSAADVATVSGDIAAASAALDKPLP